MSNFSSLDAPSGLEIILFIKEKCEKGSEVTINRRFRTIDGKMLWVIKGAGVDASGFESFTEAFIQWKESIEYLEKRRLSE